MTDHSKTGHAVLAGWHQKFWEQGHPGQPYRRPQPHPGYNRSQRASTGWTTPTVIYERMRQIQASASALDADVKTNVRRETFKAAWASWYDTWSKFFQKYQSDWAKSAALIHTDELAAQVEAYRVQLMGWYDNYGRESTPGAPLPPPSGQPPFAPPPPQVKPPEGGETGFSVPWWVWVLGGVAIVGGGYWVYKNVTRTRNELAAKREALEKYVLPTVLPAPMAHAAAARDPGIPAIGYMPPPYADPARVYVTR